MGFENNVMALKKEVNIFNKTLKHAVCVPLKDLRAPFEKRGVRKVF